jgi:hypothetical protein
MEELRQQIAEKGIPVFEALAAKLNVTKGALIKMVSDGKVPAEALLDIFMNMEGTFGKFVGGADRMGLSFVGLVSRLKGAWSLFLAEFAAPIIDHLKPILNNAIGMLESWRQKAREAGTAIGRALLAAFALIQDGKALELFRAGFRFAIAGAMDLLDRGLRSAIAFLGTALPPIFSAATSILRDPQLWQGISVFLRGAAVGFGAEIRDALGQGSLANSMREQSKQDQVLGGALVSRAGGDTNMLDTISKAIFDGAAAAVNAGSGIASPEFEEAKSNLKDLLGTMAKQVAALKKQFEITNPQGTTDAPTGGETPAVESKKKMETLTTSLGRVGGGGFGMSFSPMITEAKRTNTLLTKIANNTSGGKGRTPVIA